MKHLYKVFLVSWLILSINSNAQQLPPVVEWKKSLGGSKIDRANSVIRTLDNGYLVIAKSFSNDGDVTGHHGSTDSSDAWIVKLNSAGSIVWQRSYGGTGNDDLLHGIATANGDFICVGTTVSTNGDIPGLVTPVSDLWLLRIDQNGNIIWSKTVGTTGADRGRVIRKASNGGYIVAGDSEAATTGDYTNNNGYSDIWVLNIDDNGTVQWQKSYGNYNDQFTTDLQVASDGSYLISAYQRYRGYPTCTSPVYSYHERAYLRIDASGNVIFQQFPFFQCGNPGEYNYIFNLLELANGQLLYVGGNGLASLGGPFMDWNLRKVNGSTGQMGNLVYPTSTGPDHYQHLATQYQTGPNSAVLLPDSSLLTCMSGYIWPESSADIEGTLTRINLKSGKLDYHKRWGGQNTDYFTGLFAVNEGEYIVCGTSNSNDRDLSGNHGNYDAWVMKLNSLNKITGHVFLDINNNGIKDAGENYFSNVKTVSAKGSSTVSSSTDVNGKFLNNVDTGNYTTTANPAKPYYTVNPSSKVSSFTTYNNKDSFNFALVPIPGKKDLKVSLTALTRLRPGFQAKYTLHYVNEGTETLGVVIRLAFPWNMSFIQSVPAPVSVVNDTATWNIGSLPPLASGAINITLEADPMPGLNMNETVQLIGIIEPIAGDETPFDNRDTLIHGATASLDPNDKLENAGGSISPNQIGKNLTYTIRFQNTGNDTAFNVVVRDTLDAKLDWSSIQMIGASHNYHLAIKNGNILTWTFENILLADSVHNEPLSHGYITYRIKPKTSVVLGDTLSNSASIYFDFNPPVKTNTHLTIVKAVTIPQPSVGGIGASYCSNQGIQRGKINNLPAAGSGITTTVKLDGNALAVASDSTFSFNVSTLSAGSHLIEVIFSNGSETKTTSINFNVSIAVSPDVNATSNITTAVNTIDPVIVTAVNVAGGGTSPLYTFSKDRNFSNLWQAESSNNMLNIAPTALQTGDNWIYVRMKTSETCFTAQQNIDSIKIVFQLPIPNQPVVNGMQVSYCNNQGTQKASITNYPAPGTGTTVTVKLDGAALTLAADTSFSFDPAVLSAGNHVVEVSYSNSTGVKTTTINFTVVIAVVPDVNVTALGGSVPGVNDPYVITAVNANGGGTSPLYTFASDRNFTRVLQAEGAANSVTLPPTSLKLGDNWVYVRMKTSLSCYATQTAIDSILITRFGSVGLIDPDFPNQKISANPNPFRSQLIVHGFSSTKNYTIILYNQQGRILNRIRVINRTTITLRLPGYAAGTYLLSVYDETKKRILGTVEVVKQ